MKFCSSFGNTVHQCLIETEIPWVRISNQRTETYWRKLLFLYMAIFSLIHTWEISTRPIQSSGLLAFMLVISDVNSTSLRPFCAGHNNFDVLHRVPYFDLGWTNSPSDYLIKPLSSSQNEEDAVWIERYPLEGELWLLQKIATQRSQTLLLTVDSNIIIIPVVSQCFGW